MWPVRPADPDAARSLGRDCGLGITVAQVLLHRGFGDVARARAFLDPRLAMLTAPDAMADREVTAERIARAVRAKERIVVFGDYDVDGTTSAAILSDVLTALGGDVTAMVAHRFDGGYGFSRPALARVVDARASLVITCDCGSSDHERIRDASKQGIDVVVIDHHLVPAETLPAVAFLNPHRPECGFPYKGLASAGLALSIAAAVRKTLGAQIDLRAWLDLVALGTIADVAPLDGDNRVLVRAGLERLGRPDARPGVVALREVAKMRAGSLSASDVSFRLAPRLNAAGRLGNPQLTLDLLKARTANEARGFAAEIERINDERRSLERRITAEAHTQVRETFGDEQPFAVVVAGDGWHRGVVGITAARLVDQYGTPALVIAWDGDEGHGSGRAPDGFPLYDALKAAAPYLEKFGGHQAATGFSLRRDQLGAVTEAFRAASRGFASQIQPNEPLADVRIDGDVFPVPSASDLQRLEPLGETNAEPLFAFDGVEVIKATRVGSESTHLKLEVRVGSTTLPAFAYEGAARCPDQGARLRVLGHIRPDNWRGGDAVEMRLVDWKS